MPYHFSPLQQARNLGLLERFAGIFQCISILRHRSKYHIGCISSAYSIRFVYCSKHNRACIVCPFFATAARTTSWSSRSASLACCNAQLFCATAASTTSRSARNSAPCWHTAHVSEPQQALLLGHFGAHRWHNTMQTHSRSQYAALLRHLGALCWHIPMHFHLAELQALPLGHLGVLRSLQCPPNFPNRSKYYFSVSSEPLAGIIECISIFPNRSKHYSWYRRSASLAYCNAILSCAIAASTTALSARSASLAYSNAMSIFPNCSKHHFSVSSSASLA